MTVTGPVPVEEMGVTLMHEHILLDGARTWKCPCHPDEKAIAEQSVSIEIIGELRMNPYMNRDNVSLDDSDLALSELKRYQALGGHTVIDATNVGIGRDPEKLAAHRPHVRPQDRHGDGILPSAHAPGMAEGDGC